MHGIYALPDSWKSKIEDGSESLYSYEVNCVGMHLQDGKVVPRELSEEEKAEADAAKGGAKGGKPPPKDAKKGAKEDEPSPEELERQEKQR